MLFIQVAFLILVGLGMGLILYFQTDRKLSERRREIVKRQQSATCSHIEKQFIGNLPPIDITKKPDPAPSIDFDPAKYS